MVQKSCFYLTTPSLLFSPETFGVLIAYSSRAGFQSPGPSPVSLLSCPATAPSLAHQHWPSPTHRAHQPFPPCVFHLPRHTLPTPPPTQPLTGHTAAVQITHSAVRTQDQPFSASAASFSSPNLHTNRHLSEKKSPLKPKPIWGLDAGEREPFRSMVSRHSGKQHYLSLAPSSAPDKRGFPLDLLFKTCPKAGTRRFQINELEPPGAGSVPVPCPVPGAPTAQLLTPPCQTSPFSY